MNNKTQEALRMAIEKAMIPNTKAMQQSQSNPVFLAQGSKLVAGHEGVFVEDKNLKEIVSYHETHCAELDNVIEPLQADNAKLREALLNILVSDNDFARIDAIANEALSTTSHPVVLDNRTTQEPVAWMNDIAFSMDKDELTTDKFGDIVPLYTHPKEWQGLTNDEIWDIANFLGKNEWDYPVMFAKTIEKVLREKNNV